MKHLIEKYNELIEYLASFGRVAVAFSSGVDSTFLLYAAKEALQENAIAVTAAAGSFPVRELEESREYCKKLGVKQYICQIDEMKIDGFAENPSNRCYLCKKVIFQTILDIAHENGVSCVAEGSNLDDDGDYRPGHQAIKELGICSPLRKIGFTKQEIRDLSKHFQIPTWDKPSYACLASRFPYGERITAEKLKMVDLGEQLLLDLGFRQMRVRIHGNIARIEVMPEDFAKIMLEEIRERINAEFKRFGFAYVTLDLQGFRSGSMNEILKLV